MTKYLLKCKNCGEYGLAPPPESKKEPKCKRCGRGEMISPKPPKFSLIDKYGEIRLKNYFKEDFKKKFESEES